MKIEITKCDLIALVKGTCPHFDLFNHELIGKCGYFVGGHVESWQWNIYELEKLNEQDLKYIYDLCRNSWK